MSKFVRLLVTAVMLLALTTSFVVLAQDNGDDTDQGTTGQQTTTGQQDTTGQQGQTGQQTTTGQQSATAQQGQQGTGSQQANGLPTGATLIDIVRLTGYDTYTFDLSVVGGTGTQRTQAGQQFGQLGSLTTQL